MTGLSEQELARRAGVDEDFVRHLTHLRLIEPGSSGFAASDVPRARLLHGLERAGVPLDGIAGAIGEGHVSLAFMDSPFYERFASLRDVTFAELAVETGVSVELLMVVREAIGFGQPRPDDRLREDELRIVPTIRLLLDTGTRPAAAERLLRVYGESMRRIGEMEGHWWRTEMEEPRREAGMSEADVIAETNRLGFEIASAQEKALIEMYRAHHEHAATKNMIEDVERALAAAGVRSRLDSQPAICFLDITGYTRLAEERGDEAAADLAGRLARMVERSSRSHGGRPVKWLGDGVMLYFDAPKDGVLAGLEMVGAVAETGLPPAHIGINAGPVVFQEADYFGRTVNVAARIADYARPGEVVVSDAVVQVSEGSEISFSEIGPVELKGIPSPVRLYSAYRTG